jgi:AAA15 family ATPase/GTPase
MLKQIEIKNFRSFNDTQIFTMEALPPSSLKEHPEHVIPVDGGGMLKLGSIYGPNGSGKSNLIKALSILTEIGANPRDFYFRIRSFDEPFAGSDSKVASLSYTFEDGEYETVLSFSYSVDQKAKAALEERYYLSSSPSPYAILFEKLSFRKVGSDEVVTAYVREKGKIVADELLKEIGIPAFAVTASQLLVNFVAEQYSIPGRFYGAVASCNRQIRSLSRLGDVDFGFYRFASRKTNCEYLAKKLNAILKTNISGIHLDKTKNDYSLAALKFDHKVGEKTFTLSFFDESEGTQKLAAVIAGLKGSKGGRIYYADDFDSHLHPVLIRALLSFFGSEDNPNSQFIFNSHDILNMDAKYFRRDEIWFTTLDEEGSTRLYALSDLTGPDGRVIRKDKRYSKQYLEGHYGADPFVAKGLKL